LYEVTLSACGTRTRCEAANTGPDFERFLRPPVWSGHGSTRQSRAIACAEIASGCPQAPAACCFVTNTHTQSVCRLSSARLIHARAILQSLPPDRELYLVDHMSSGSCQQTFSLPPSPFPRPRAGGLGGSVPWFIAPLQHRVNKPPLAHLRLWATVFSFLATPAPPLLHAYPSSLLTSEGNTKPYAPPTQASVASISAYFGHIFNHCV